MSKALFLSEFCCPPEGMVHQPADWRATSQQKQPVLVSSCCYNKLLELGDFTQIYCLIVLKVRSPKWLLLGWNQGVVGAESLLKASGQNLAFVSF